MEFISTKMPSENDETGLDESIFKAGEKTTAESEPILPYPTEGVNFQTFKDFVDGIGREALVGLTTTKVCELYIKPRTLEHQSSYCDYLTANELAIVEKATVFVSHAWGCLFLELYDTLTNHFQYEPKTIIWFDLFSNN